MFHHNSIITGVVVSNVILAIIQIIDNITIYEFFKVGHFRAHRRPFS